MKYLALLSLFVLFNACKVDKETVAKPNIILINIDDLGYTDLSFMGSEYYNTPHIDALAKSGMIFTNGYAAAANCSPSRASIMTGKWTTRHGIYTVGSSERGQSKYRKLIPTINTVTLAKTHRVISGILQRNGYQTIHAGKWHLSDSPLDYGFDINIGGGHNGHPKSYYPPYGNVQLKNSGKEYLTDLIMEYTIESLDSIDQPFFLNYAPYAVHTPIQPVDSLLVKYTNKTAWKGQNNPKYASMIENLDRNIGMLVSTLKRNRLFDNTFIVFTSDNGGLYGITQQQPLRAGKGSYYEGGIREPFFFVWEGNIEACSKNDVPITHLDLFPTLLQVAGIETEIHATDGINLVPLLRQKVTDIERPLFWHFPIYLQAYNVHNNENRDSLFRTRPGSVIRKGNWKLHFYFENNEMELYNLADDISERNNLVETHPKKVEELLVQLKTWWKGTNAPIPRERNREYDSRPKE
ncbi:MAG: sulfatase [Maribacter sp.]|nr:sulfatase [Maribacter sp.]